MGEIKPGILALVVKARDDLYTGMIVQVSHWISRGDTAPSGRLYDDSGGWVCYGHGMRSQTMLGPVPEVSGYAIFATSRLLPINPSADPLEQTQEQEQTA